MLQFCARRVAARACPRGTLAQALHSMPPKKTPTSEKDSLKGQRNIATFFKGAAGDKRSVATSPRKSSDAATSPANKALKPADLNGATATDKRPLKRLKKAAGTDAAAEAAAQQPEESTDLDMVEERSNGDAEPSASPAAPEPAPSPAPPASAKGASGAAEATPPKAKQAAGALEAAETAAEVRPASRNEAFSHEPETAPEAHLAELAQPELQQQHVELKVLVDAFDRISATTKRLEMTDELKRTLRLIIDTNPCDLLPAVYLISNRIAPAHAAVELGIGEGMVKKAICKATGMSTDQLNKKLKEGGDLGDVATAERKKQTSLGSMFSKQKAPAAALTIKGVYDKFWEIARAKGSASQDKKQAIIQALIVASRPRTNEAGVIIRAMLGKLRIGLAEQTLLVALAQAVLEQRARGRAVPASVVEEGVNMVKKENKARPTVYSECPVYDELIPALLEVAAGNLPVQDIGKTVSFRPGLPVKAMLAKPTNGISEVLDKYHEQPFTVEYKYDGERAQIHVDEHGKVHIFSRNSENMLEKYPDLEARVPQLLAKDVKTVVVDCEAVAWDVEQHKILPFQMLSTRARKNVKIADIKVQVYLFAFDCLYLNGRNILGEPLTARREALKSALVETPDQLQFAQFKTSTDVEELSLFLDEAVAAGTEGLIVKSLDSTYEPSKRSVNWLKLKKDYLQGVGDTFDVVPIGAFYGKGKRAGVYGAFLLAVYDDNNETFQTISKIGTGFSEELLKELHEQHQGQVIERPPKYYSYATNTKLPDVWLDAKAVWEVKAADLSISPVYKAATGLVDAAKGISIRFPRLVRVRDDKAPEQATTPEQIAEMYQQQASQQKRKGAAKDDDDD